MWGCSVGNYKRWKAAEAERHATWATLSDTIHAQILSSLPNPGWRLVSRGLGRSVSRSGSRDTCCFDLYCPDGTVMILDPRLSEEDDEVLLDGVAPQSYFDVKVWPRFRGAR